MMQMQLALDAGFPPVADEPECVNCDGCGLSGPEPDAGPCTECTFVPIRYDVIERAMLALPQVETPTTHHFGPGTYLRQMFAPAGTLVLGREHRGPCMNVMLTGRCALIDTDGSVQELTAPRMFVSPAGRKLAYVLEDMAWVNIWATTQTDVDALEQELFVMGPTS